MNIDQTIAVITGGSSGMGLACANRLAAQGAQVVIWDKNTQSSDFQTIECDVANEEAVTNALQQTITQIGIPRIGINCAGIAPAKRLIGRDGMMPLSDFKHVIDINLVGTFNVMRVLADAMTRLSPIGESNERGVLINTASIAAFEGQIGQMAYSASKGGIVSMTLPAARELAQYGIRVNTIAPGLIATPLLLNMPESVQATLADTVPFPKRPGYPEEFAALVTHIIENTLINGETIRLDGALRMQAK